MTPDVCYEYIEKIAKLMQREGILSLKTLDLELEISPAAIIHNQPPDPAQKVGSGSPLPEKPLYSEEELLLWSAPGFIPDEAPKDNLNV